MMSKRMVGERNWWLAGLLAMAAGAFVLVFARPGTHWVAGQELAAPVVCPPLIVHCDRTEGIDAPGWVKDRLGQTALRLQHAAKKAPSDWGVQLAAYGGALGWNQVDPLRALLPRCPGSLAAVIRRESTFYIPRDTEATAMPGTPRDSMTGRGFQEYGMMLQDSAQGIRIDPGNAFFPVAYADALIQLGKPAEAMGYLVRASHCVRWDSYAAEEQAGQVRLWALLDGRASGLDECESTHFPLMNGLPSVASAVLKYSQNALPSEDGIQLRMALMRVGDLMMHAQDNWNSRVNGRFIVVRGAVGLDYAAPYSAKARWAWIEELRQAGHPAEANEAQALFKDVQQVNMQSDPYEAIGPLEFPLYIAWITGFGLAASALWMLVLAGLSWLGGVRWIPRWAPTGLVAVAVVLMLACAWLCPWAGALTASANALTGSPGISSNFPPGLIRGISVVVCTLLPLTALLAAVIHGIGRNSAAESLVWLARSAAALGAVLFLLFVATAFITDRLDSSVMSRVCVISHPASVALSDAADTLLYSGEDHGRGYHGIVRRVGIVRLRGAGAGPHHKPCLQMQAQAHRAAGA